MNKGSLTVVGTGIRLIGQVTHEARLAIEQAEKVLYLVTDPVTEIWIKQLNPTAESLSSSYEDNKPRIDAYVAMIERVLGFVRDGLDVCAIFYGHPGVFVYPSHEAVRLARTEGYSASMFPGISAEDCLFADLGIDPARSGCQSFEATDFLVHRRKFDSTSSLILWQIGVVGDLGYKRSGYSRRGLHVLVRYLEQYYGADHETAIYEAPIYAICDPFIQEVPLAKVPEAHVSPISTLYIPPKDAGVPDEEMLEQLGLASSDLYVKKGCWETGHSVAKTDSR